MYIYRELVLTEFDFGIGRLHLVGLKRRFSKGQCIADDPARPDVYLVRVSCRALDYFWCDVVWSSTDCSFLLLGELQLGGQPKIPNFEFHVCVDKDVAHLKVSVDDSVGVHMLY